MPSKKKLLANSRLYLILDRQVHEYPKLFEIAREATAAGIDVIQLRDKSGNARDILEFSKRILRLTRAQIPYMINDRIDLAILAKASGVHLGQEDIPLTSARRMLGSKAMIGISCQTFEHAQKAQEEGADYIGFGSVFKTLTKPKRQPMDVRFLERIIKNIKIPIFAIGGITLENVASLQTLGVKRVAVCRAICESQNVTGVVRDFKEALRG